MAKASQLAGKMASYRRWLKVRPLVLIPGLLGGGRMIVFPAASALVVGYIAFALAAIGMMAWTGIIAFATAAVAALLLPVASGFAVLGLVAAVRGLMRIAGPAGVAHEVKQQADSGGDKPNAAQNALDRWETDGGRAVPTRPRCVRRHARRGYIVHLRARGTAGRSASSRSDPSR